MAFVSKPLTLQQFLLQIYARVLKAESRVLTDSKREHQKFCYLTLFQIFKINRLRKGTHLEVREVAAQYVRSSKVGKA